MVFTIYRTGIIIGHSVFPANRIPVYCTFTNWWDTRGRITGALPCTLNYNSCYISLTCITKGLSFFTTNRIVPFFYTITSWRTRTFSYTFSRVTCTISNTGIFISMPICTANRIRPWWTATRRWRRWFTGAFPITSNRLTTTFCFTGVTIGFVVSATNWFPNKWTETSL